MATKIIKVPGQNAGKIIAKGLMRPIKDAKKYFTILGQLVDQQTQLTFRLNGARAGRNRWSLLKLKTIQSKSGTFNIRYGTDGTPKPIFSKGDGKKRTLRKGVRRYTGRSDNILQASGLFRKSFKIIKTTRTEMQYKTNHQLADKVMSNPTRQVLFVTRNDLNIYQKRFRNFIDKGIIF